MHVRNFLIISPPRYMFRTVLIGGCVSSRGLWRVRSFYLYNYAFNTAAQSKTGSTKKGGVPSPWFHTSLLHVSRSGLKRFRRGVTRLISSCFFGKINPQYTQCWLSCHFTGVSSIQHHGCPFHVLSHQWAPVSKREGRNEVKKMAHSPFTSSV